MTLVVCGLGNPGSEYEYHRHNIGFQVVEKLASNHRASFSQRKFDGELCTLKLGSENIILVKPQTFMNVSGQCVSALMHFYKLESTQLLVVHDELDLPFSQLQLKQGGGSGGHNGLKSISSQLATENYGRLRFGVSKPQGENVRDRIAGYVLSNFSKDENQTLDELIVESARAVTAWAELGMAKAMNQFNRKVKK